MYRILTASKDTYITNKIINNKFRAKDANVGEAASIDIFKLYSESTSGSDTTPTEVSRGLIKFDLEPLRKLTGSMLDITHSSFRCNLIMRDVYGGQTTPSNFKIIVYPLSKSFDEGIGRDIISFADLDSSNFLTASVISGVPVPWNNEGANKAGLLKSSNIDIISSGSLGKGVVDIWRSQEFKTGIEDLNIDITHIVSATLKNQIPDHGFRISYSGTMETDEKTRFVKRFGSRNNTSFFNKPQIEVKYNDSMQDHHRSFFFNLSGSLFLNNFHRGKLANMLSGSGATSITGSNSLLLKLVSGTLASGTYYSKTITASQHSIGENFVTGVYSASFAISQWATGALEKEIKNANSCTFTEIWSSMDGTVGFYTGSLVVNTVKRTSFANQTKRVVVSITNMKSEFRRDDKYRFRIFAEDIDRPIRARKVPIESPSEIFNNMHYQIRDFESGRIVVGFDTQDNSTLLSTDQDGMYFDFYMDTLFTGAVYNVEFLLRDEGIDQLFTDVAAKFRVI